MVYDIFEDYVRLDTYELKKTLKKGDLIKFYPIVNPEKILTGFVKRMDTIDDPIKVMIRIQYGCYYYPLDEYIFYRAVDKEEIHNEYIEQIKELELYCSMIECDIGVEFANYPGKKNKNCQIREEIENILIHVPDPKPISKDTMDMIFQQYPDLAKYKMIDQSNLHKIVKKHAIVLSNNLKERFEVKVLHISDEMTTLRCKNIEKPGSYDIKLNKYYLFIPPPPTIIKIKKK